jgi:hypothetical protein
MFKMCFSILAKILVLVKLVGANPVVFTVGLNEQLVSKAGPCTNQVSSI